MTGPAWAAILLAAASPWLPWVISSAKKSGAGSTSHPAPSSASPPPSSTPASAKPSTTTNGSPNSITSCKAPNPAPSPRLIRGTTYATGLLIAAHRIARHITRAPAAASKAETDIAEPSWTAALMPTLRLVGVGAVPADWDADRAITELYGTHYRSLVRLAAVLLRDVATAEEVVQDSFVAMHGSWRRLRDSDKALSYLQQSVVNRSQSVLQHRQEGQ